MFPIWAAPPSASAAVGIGLRHKASAMRQLKTRFFIDVLLWFFPTRSLSPAGRMVSRRGFPYGSGGAPGQFFRLRRSVQHIFRDLWGRLHETYFFDLKCNRSGSAQHFACIFDHFLNDGIIHCTSTYGQVFFHFFDIFSSHAWQCGLPPDSF